MGELKSAWQIAMEKAEKLGAMSPDEIRKHKEEKLTSIGEAIAERYLNSGDVKGLEMDLGKYKADERAQLSKVLIAALVRALTLKEREKVERTLSAIPLIRDNEESKRFVVRIRELVRERDQVEQNRRKEIDKQGTAILRQLGISGSAIKTINLKASGEWLQNPARLAPPLEDKLNRYKQEFLPTN